MNKQTSTTQPRPNPAGNRRAPAPLYETASGTAASRPVSVRLRMMDAKLEHMAAEIDKDRKRAKAAQRSAQRQRDVLAAHQLTRAAMDARLAEMEAEYKNDLYPAGYVSKRREG